jgi:hypothetical protein
MRHRKFPWMVGPRGGPGQDKEVVVVVLVEERGHHKATRLEGKNGRTTA